MGEAAMSEEFKIGDVVTLKCVNAALVVVEGPGRDASCNLQDGYRCAWMDRDMHVVREWFPAAALRTFKERS